MQTTRFQMLVIILLLLLLSGVASLIAIVAPMQSQWSGFIAEQHARAQADARDEAAVQGYTRQLLGGAQARREPASSEPAPTMHLIPDH